MNFFRIFFASVIFVFLSTGVALGATDTFTVQTLVGGDTTPPSAPSNLVATPVAVSQIDLSWSSSTDNWSLGGYQVFKSGPGTTSFSQIATTTSVSYSDIGLTSSTTYSYYVTAFDDAGNISASSSVVSTTTLASSSPPTPTPISTPSSGGSAPKLELTPVPIALEQLEIIPHETSVTLRYVTEGYVRSIVRWGSSISYELGSLQERAFRKDHETIITGLEPGTTYRFTIEGENHLGKFGVLTIDSFTTLPSDDTESPANVSNLDAYIADDTDIVLKWNNPRDGDFSHVRVLRSDRFYPSDTADGWLVYEGDGESVRDSDAATPGTTQYYSVFAYDEEGNVSSGAVVHVRIPGGTPDEVEDEDTTGPPSPEEEAPDEIDLSFDDLIFTQEGRELQHDGDRVAIDGAKRLTISVLYERMPKHLKTITLTVSRPDGSELGSFLLRADDQHTFYTTTLSPFSVEGRFPITISVYDFETFKIGSASGYLISSIAHMPEPESGIDIGFFSFLKERFTIDTNIMFFVSILLLILLIIIALLVLRQYAHAND